MGWRCVAVYSEPRRRSLRRCGINRSGQSNRQNTTAGKSLVCLYSIRSPVLEQITFVAGRGKAGDIRRDLVMNRILASTSEA